MARTTEPRQLFRNDQANRGQEARSGGLWRLAVRTGGQDCWSGCSVALDAQPFALFDGDGLTTPDLQRASRTDGVVVGVLLQSHKGRSPGVGEEYNRVPHLPESESIARAFKSLLLGEATSKHMNEKTHDAFMYHTIQSTGMEASVILGRRASRPLRSGERPALKSLHTDTPRPQRILFERHGRLLADIQEFLKRQLKLDSLEKKTNKQIDLWIKHNDAELYWLLRKASTRQQARVRALGNEQLVQPGSPSETSTSQRAINWSGRMQRGSLGGVLAV